MQRVKRMRRLEEMETKKGDGSETAQFLAASLPGLCEIHILLSLNMSTHTLMTAHEVAVACNLPRFETEFALQDLILKGVCIEDRGLYGLNPLLPGSTQDLIGDIHDKVE